MLHGHYVAGWIKRGPTGIIGTNKPCASETIDGLLADAMAGRLAPAPERSDDLLAMLRGRGVRVTDWGGWQRIDATEVARGTAAGKPREKMTSIDEMLAAAE
jgi:ferredoxin--NADP+ reductase